ncbi:zinc finger protein [Macleaya cordata]|uniref:Zinc finger protein n=1 Tax=Macleaya cordata TaxID=56857 RepID=A0A200PMX3_MACCD|nr:zinc finger protein [Macleaya cordata]
MEHRYAQIPPPPPPLSYPPRFSSDNRNFYHHRFPPPPPPPPPPFHHPPRFPYFPPMEDEPTRRHMFDLQPSPRVSSDHHHNVPTTTVFDHHHQFRQPEDDFPNFYAEEEGHRDVWMKPSRFPIAWDHNPHHHHRHHRDRPFNHSISPHHHHHREAASNCYYFVDQKRFVEHPHEEKDEEGRIFPEYYSSGRDGSYRNQKDDFFWTQDDCRPNSGNGNGNGNYLCRYNLGNHQEQEQFLDDVEDRRRLKNPARLSSIIREVNDSSVDKSAVGKENEEKRSFDIKVNDDGHRVFTRKQHFSHHHQPKNGKFKSMADGGDISQEFLRTPKKKRTSALLRVQSAKKSTPRKWRGGEESLSSAQHFNDTNSGPARCRGPLVFSDDKPPGEHREASPVEELDVSFKSNSLVAKAKTVPSNSSGSPVTEILEGLVKGDSSNLHGVDPALRSNESLTKSKDSVIDAETGPVDNNGLQPCTNGIDASLDHSGVVRSLSSTIVGSDGICKPEIKMKKKKKKRKKKVAAPNLGLLNSQVTEVHEGPVSRDSPTPGLDASVSANVGLTQSEEKVKDAGIGIAGLQSCLNGNNASLKNMDIIESPCSPMDGSDVMCTAKVKRTRSMMVPLSGLSNSRKTEIYDRFINTDSSNKEKLAAFGVESMDDIGLQPLNWFTVSLENSRGVRSPPNCVVGSDDTPKTKKKRRVVDPLSGFARLMVTESHDEHVNAVSSTHGADAASSSEKSLTHSEEKIIASGIENSGEVGSPPSCMVGSDDTPKTKKRRRLVYPLSGLSRLRITESHDKPVNAVSSTHGADASSSFDKSPTHTEEKVTVSGIGNVDDVGSQPLLMVISSCENRAAEQSPSSLAVGNDGECTPVVKKMNKQGSLNLGLSSSWVTEIVEKPENADTCRHGVGARSNSYKAPMQPEEKTMVSDIVSMSDVDSQPLHRFTEPLENRGEVGFPVVTEEDVRNFTHPTMYSHFFVESSVLNMHSSSSELESGQQDVIPVVTVSNCQRYPFQKDIIELETGGERGDQTEVDAAGHGLFSRVTCEDIALHSQSQENVGISPLEVQSSDLDERVPCKAFEDDSCDLLVKDELLSMPNNMSPGADCSSLSITNSNEGMDCTSDCQTKIDSQESLSSVPELQILNSQQLHCYMSGKKGCRTNNRLDEKFKAIDGVVLKGNDSSASDPDLKVTSDEALQDDHLVPERTLLLQSEDTKQLAPVPNLIGGELTGRKTYSSSSMPKATLSSGSLKQSSSSTPVARHRTWHRTDNISSSPHANSCLIDGTSQRQSQKRCGKIQSTSYIRKGNSLVRKYAPVASLPQGSHGLSNSVYWLNSVGRDETKKGAGSEKKLNSIKPLNGLKTGFERVTTPTLPHHSKSSNCTTKSFQDFASSKSTIPLLEGASETTTNPTKISESKDAPKQAGASENQAGVNRMLGTQSIINNGKSKFSTTKKIIYVKRKSNQLVAARHPEIHDPSASVLEKNQAVASSISYDQYYKRNKNQLIRNVPSVQSHFKPAVTVPEESLHLEGQRTPKVSSLKCGRNVSKQRPDKNFFPWKRMIYWRKDMASGSNRSSSSLIGRKLLLSRKRDTVYTRSTGGFSLRRSKVLSIGGSNLKWSKSIEKRSKIANEEATLAVAAVEKKKREQKGAAYAVARAKSRNQSSRERIFRIGSVRYRMDSSRRTLQRIPDEKSSSGLDQRSGKNTKMSFIPKRLLIGNNEYVRIGNGNQLVRDPKTRIRILASEKVRWSLHTARLRLARKQQYCQFFTRFGKCNKDGGKCPYIHDPAKIAVCTKFLNGLCSNTNCKLTHKVIPERMQDCSYFLQGLCTNENCPYRHVNVNPNASVCEGFLRGYCADGNECPQGTKCKLHHPRSRNTKNRKRKRAKDNTKKTRRRYFGSNRFNGENETGKIASGKHTEQKKNEDSVCHEGILGDYISLDVSESDDDEEAQETTDGATMDTNTNLCCDGHPSSDLLLQSDDLDDDDGDDDELLIKPVAIMNTKKQTQT